MFSPAIADLPPPLSRSAAAPLPARSLGSARLSPALLYSARLSTAAAWLAHTNQGYPAASTAMRRRGVRRLGLDRPAVKGPASRAAGRVELAAVCVPEALECGEFVEVLERVRVKMTFMGNSTVEHPCGRMDSPTSGIERKQSVFFSD